jgi:hypothetical protein
MALGCTTVHVQTNADSATDFSCLRTFSFGDGKTVAHVGGLQVDDPLVSERIRGAVSVQLEAKGLTRVSDHPDLLVRFLAGVRERKELDTWGLVGYSEWYPGYEDWWTRRYTEGTVIVDLVDAHSQKLVWRAYMEADMDNPSQGGKVIDAAVAKAFQRYPVLAPGYGGSGPAAR